MRGDAHDAGAVRLHALAAVLMFLLVMGALLTHAQAQEGIQQVISEETARLIERMDLTEIVEQAPEMDVVRILKDAVQGDFSIDGEGLTQAVRRTLVGKASGLIPRMVRILGITVLCAALLRLRSLTGRDGISRLMETLAYLCMILPVAYDFSALLAQGRAVTERMVNFYQAVLPTMLALMTSMGGAHSAMMMSELSLTATGFLAGFVETVLFAVLGFAAALACLNNFAPEIRLGRALKLLRTGIHWCLGISFTVFLGLLTAQGATSSSYDGVTLRAAKYAIDKFVPVVGGVFKDTADTLVGCSVVVKNAVGVVGLAGLALLILEPCLEILMTLSAYRLCAAALDPLGETRIVSALCDFADILTTLFILIISVGAMFFVFIAALMRVGMGFT